MIVRPLSSEVARDFCRRHPHAGSMPNSSKYFMGAFEGTKFLGLAVWGWGIVPSQTPKKLFGSGTTNDYLELNRFFVVDDAPKNSASKFLNITATLIKKYNKNIKYLYTYAAGFQGLIGTIYQAAGYEYIGTTKVRFPYIEGVGIVHPISLYHRYKKTNPKFLRLIYGEKYKQWNGLNFCYIKFLCSKEERVQLLKHASFKILPYPLKEDIKIWDGGGRSIDPNFAKTVPMVKLKSKVMR